MAEGDRASTGHWGGGGGGGGARPVLSGCFQPPPLPPPHPSFLSSATAPLVQLRPAAAPHSSFAAETNREFAV